MKSSKENVGRVAASGVFWLTIAKFYFMVTGFLLLLILPSLLKKFAGSEHVKLYGDYRTVIGVINWINMVLIAGTIQAVSKFVSEDPGRAGSVLRNTLKIQVVIGGSIALLLFLLSGPLAQYVYRSAELAGYIRLAAPIILLYACYAAIIGCMNGLKRFFHQASMDMLFATFKVGLTILFVALGWAIYGIIGAFLVTASILLVVSRFVLGKLEKQKEVKSLDILRFEWKTLLYGFFLNGMLQVDLQALKIFGPSGAAGSKGCGIYAAALQIGQLPYVATISVAFVIFPILSKVTFEKDVEKTREYVRVALRYMVIFLALVGTLLWINARGILDVVYPDEYLAGTKTLKILGVAYCFFALLVLYANMFTSSGRPMLSVVIFAGGTATSMLLSALAASRYGFEGVAVAVLFTMVATSITAILVGFRLFGTFVSLVTLVRIALAAIGSLLIGWKLTGSNFLQVVVASVLQSIIFLAILFLTREVTVSEVSGILRSWMRKGA